MRARDRHFSCARAGTSQMNSLKKEKDKNLQNLTTISFEGIFLQIFVHKKT